MRIAERYLPGVTPMASLKVRQKWNRLIIALLAISARDNGSLYFSYMNLIARSWALFIDLLSRFCGSDAVRASYRLSFCNQTLTITMHHAPRIPVVPISLAARFCLDRAFRDSIKQ